jgi:CubicO group peptidase (beta-lactamase class C family)
MHSKAQIDQILRQKSDAVEIPGVVAMAASGNEVIYQGAFGKRDLSKPDNMTTDSVFWIASMTKAVTAMQLVEQGKLSLEAPIGKLLPDLAAPQVLEGFDAKGEPRLRPAKSPITLRQLMTHTAGFCYDMWNGDMGTYLQKNGLPPIISCKDAALKTPIASDPGTRWEYGINIDFVGKAVEAVSGKKAGRLSARSSVCAARHERYRFQVDRHDASTPRRHAHAWTGRITCARLNSNRIRNSTWVAAFTARRRTISNSPR